MTARTAGIPTSPAARTASAPSPSTSWRIVGRARAWVVVDMVILPW